MIKMLLNYCYTIKHLKAKQIFSRLYYFLRNRLRELFGFKYHFHGEKESVTLKFDEMLPQKQCFDSGTFTFLNRSKDFSDELNWNFPDFGNLWTYNLNYFDYLNQDNINVEDGLRLINDFIENIDSNKAGLEPFPISLRCINWIKFLSKNKVKNKEIDGNLFAQYRVLLDNLEYHLLGNHYLENGFSLLFGAYYFNDIALYEKAKSLLISELNEQILDDGGHFELSPMYHQLMLYRVLDCINLIKNNSLFDGELLSVFTEKAEKMLGWLKQITFKNGDIPLLNDSAHNIAPTTEELFEYAGRLGIKINEIPLGVCGYRKFNRSNYEMVVDAGNIGPDYIPGHAHSDTFNFELHVGEKPFIVDTGTSTYELNSLRGYQRSTKAHNTVQIGNDEQSEVWGSFRVARRAYVMDMKEANGKLSAAHTGYKRIGCVHKREFSFDEDRIVIQDTIESKKGFDCYSYLHFHPNVKLEQKENQILANGKSISFDNVDTVTISGYQYAPEFNKTIEAQMVTLTFKNYLTTKIDL